MSHSRGQSITGQDWLNNDYTNEDALAKKEERAKHRRDSSVATPDVFKENYNHEKVFRMYYSLYINTQFELI